VARAPAFVARPSALPQIDPPAELRRSVAEASLDDVMREQFEWLLYVRTDKRAAPADVHRLELLTKLLLLPFAGPKTKARKTKC